jgi:PEGA domain
MIVRTVALTLLIFLTTCMPLLAETGVVEIYSVPEGLNVYLNGIFVGHTPYSNPDIEVGEHTISVSTPDSSATQSWTFTVDGLTPLTKWFYFEEPKPSKFNGVPEEPAIDKDTGNIQFASIPTGATVYVNGDKLNTTPISYRDVDIGLYSVAFELNGKWLKGTFRVENDETGKLIADFDKNQLIDKWQKEKSKTERIQHAEEEKAEKILEAEHEKVLKERLKSYSAADQRRILDARDQVFTIVPIEYMYNTNRTYYYNAMKLNDDVVRFYKLPYDKITLEIKNLKSRESQLVGVYYEGDYVFRYGKHIRRGKLISSDLGSCKIKLYNDIVIKLRYDPDTAGYGKGEGRVFLSIR